MDEAAFQKELSKYKIVRRADHYKVRWNKKKTEVKRLADRSHVQTPVIKEFASGANFWDVVTGAPRSGLSSAEWAKFIAALRESHESILRILNLEDLESLAEIAASG